MLFRIQDRKKIIGKVQTLAQTNSITNIVWLINLSFGDTQHSKKMILICTSQPYSSIFISRSSIVLIIK